MVFPCLGYIPAGARLTGLHGAYFQHARYEINFDMRWISLGFA